MTHAHTSADIREPRNPSELVRLLKVRRPNQHREVEIWDSKAVYSNRSTSDHVFDIDVHPESELVLRVHTGLPFLKLKRGTSRNVTVLFESSWGNSLEIFPGQGATVSVPYRDIKVTLNGDGRDLQIEVGGELSRFRKPLPGQVNRVRNFTHTDEEVIQRVFARRYEDQ